MTSEPDELAQYRLRVIAIVDDAPTQELLSRVAASTHDRLVVARDLAEGLALVAQDAPQLVLIDVSMGDNAGLAVVHHVQALTPGVLVYALVPAEMVQLCSQALSLGSAGLLLLPLSGDELLLTLSDVRTRLAERTEREELQRAQAEAERSRDLVSRVGDVASCQNRRIAASQLAEMLVHHQLAEGALVYILTGERSRQLMRAATARASTEGPSFCEEMELLRYAAESDLRVVRLTLGTVHQGFLLLEGPRMEQVPLWELFVAQATIALALIGEREQSHRGAMKDPHSSAYTFAYFVDVAGREIDKAVRHSRRFALATVTLADDANEQSNIEMADRLLAAVRDTDIVARIDETEFYLLLPETGGIGAHACRRRILTQLGTDEERQGVLMGLATFPHDGRDLSQLLRVAKFRAEASARSLAHRRDLWKVPMGELLDSILWETRDDVQSIESPRAIELPVRDVLTMAATAVQEAARSGATWLLATQRAGLSLAAAVRAAVGRDRDAPRLETMDLSAVEGCRDLEVLALVTQHGTYTLLGRVSGDIMRAVHSADPLFVDLVAERAGAALGTRFVY